jgi:integrase
VAEWIRAHVDPRDRLRGDVPLFVNPATGGRWTQPSERRVHLAACEEIGAYFKPNHCGRHAFGTHALRRTKERGGSHDLAAVQKAMRHSDPRTTQGYIDRDVIDLVGVLRRRPGRR